MGCFNETCMIDQRSITYSSEVVAIPLIKNNDVVLKAHNTNPMVSPFGFFLYGVYDDYGAIHSIEDNFASQSLLNIINNDLQNATDETIENITSDLNFDDKTGFDVEKKEFKDFNTLIRSITRGNVLFDGRELFIAMMNKDTFENFISIFDETSFWGKPESITTNLAYLYNKIIEGTDKKFNRVRGFLKEGKNIKDEALNLSKMGLLDWDTFPLDKNKFNTLTLISDDYNSFFDRDGSNYYLNEFLKFTDTDKSFSEVEKLIQFNYCLDIFRKHWHIPTNWSQENNLEEVYKFYIKQIKSMDTILESLIEENDWEDFRKDLK